MNDTATMTRGLWGFICGCFLLAGVLAWNNPAPRPVRAAGDPVADGRAFVAQVDADRLGNPGRREKALNECVRLDDDGRVNWTKAKACYDRF